MPDHRVQGRLAFATADAHRTLSDDDRLAAAELRRRGYTVEPAVWSDPGTDWPSFEAVVIRSCWDYHLALERFLGWAAALDGMGVPVFNPPSMLRWNADKHYLGELERAGISSVPTRWLGRGRADELPAFLDSLQWPELVMKPAVSASAYRTVRLSRTHRGDLVAAARHILAHGDLLVQPFLDAVVREGEWALMFMDGRYSHAVLKRPAEGDFRVQQEWGGRETAVDPAPAMLDAASRAVAHAGASLYARVDGVLHEGAFLVMELELIEPYLFFEYDPGAAVRFADAVERWLTARRRP